MFKINNATQCCNWLQKILTVLVLKGLIVNLSIIYNDIRYHKDNIGSWFRLPKEKKQQHVQSILVILTYQGNFGQRGKKD